MFLGWFGVKYKDGYTKRKLIPTVKYDGGCVMFGVFLSKALGILLRYEASLTPGDLKRISCCFCQGGLCVMVRCLVEFGGVVVQWLAQSPYSRKLLGRANWGLSAWTLCFLPVGTLVSIQSRAD